jgi:hypothetical protein
MKWLRTTLFLVLLFLVLTPSVLADTPNVWQGINNYQVVIQGSLSTLNLPSGYSTSIPMDFRTKLEVELFSPNSDGLRKGVVRLVDTYVQQQGTGYTVATNPEGYELTINKYGIIESLNESAELFKFGLNLYDILSVIFSPIPDALETDISWSTDEVHQVSLMDRDVFFDVTNIYQITEMDDLYLEIKNIISGDKEESTGDATVSISHLGQGISHYNPKTLEMTVAAVSRRTTVEEKLEKSRNITQVFTSTVVERIEIPRQLSLFLGYQYVDPAQRFALRLPANWYPEADIIHKSHTMFIDPTGTEILSIEVLDESEYINVDQLITKTLEQYQTQLSNLQVITNPTGSSLGNKHAYYTEYTFTDFEPYTEGLLAAKVNDHYYVLQYMAPTSVYQSKGKQLIQYMAKEFEYGAYPQGQIDLEKILAAPYIVYENYQHHYSIDIPNLWFLAEETANTMLFQEVGGNGQLTVQVEETMINTSSYALLHLLLEDFTKENPNVEVIMTPQPMALGPIPGAGALIGWEYEGVNWRRLITTAVLDETLYIVSIDYHADGFDERYGLFQRMIAGFQPLPDWVNADLQDANTTPASPVDEESILLIGRVLYEYYGEGMGSTPASNVLVKVYCDEEYLARTDEEGYFYIANLPKARIYIEGVQGPLFYLTDDVSVTLYGLEISPGSDRIVHMGEMVLSYEPFEGDLFINIDNSPKQNEAAESHFIENHPRTDWAQFIRDRMKSN